MLKVARSRYIAFTLIITFFLFCNQHLLATQASEQGSLVGFIFAEDGSTAVEGAVVKLKNIIEDANYTSGKTDPKGAFKIEGIEEGIYWAGISTPQGDFNFENFIGIKKGETAKISLSLIPTEVQSISPPEEMMVSEPEESTNSSMEEDPFLAQGASVADLPLEGIFIGKVANYDIGAMEAYCVIEEGTMRVGDELHFRGITTNFSQKVESIRIESDYVKKASAGQVPAVRVIDRVMVGDFVYLTAKKKPFLLFSPVGVATVLATTAGVVYGIVKLKEEEPEVSPFKK
jgi:hypothetical protein